MALSVKYLFPNHHKKYIIKAFSIYSFNLSFIQQIFIDNVLSAQEFVFLIFWGDISEKYRILTSYEVYVLKYICMSTTGEGVVSKINKQINKTIMT